MILLPEGWIVVVGPLVEAGDGRVETDRRCGDNQWVPRRHRLFGEHRPSAKRGKLVLGLPEASFFNLKEV